MSKGHNNLLKTAGFFISCAGKTESAWKNLKQSFSSRCSIAGDRHIKIIYSHTVVFLFCIFEIMLIY